MRKFKAVLVIAVGLLALYAIAIAADTKVGHENKDDCDKCGPTRVSIARNSPSSKLCISKTNQSL